MKGSRIYIEIVIIVLFILSIPAVIVATNNISMKNPEEYQLTASECVALGDQFFNKGRLYYSQAAVLYWEALKQDPKLLDVRFKLAQIYYEYVWNNEAIDQLRKIEKIDPKFPELYTLMGKAYDKLGRSDDAFKAFQRAVQFQPDDPEAHYYLGIIYQQRNMEEEAIRSYERSTSLLGKLTDKRKLESIVRSYLQLGRIYKNKQDLEKSESALKTASRIDPSSVEVKTELKSLYEQEAEMYKSQKDFDKAVAKYEEIIKLDPENKENSWIYVEIGNIYRSKELYNKAKAAYDKAAKLDPLNYDAFSALKEIEILRRSAGN